MNSGTTTERTPHGGFAPAKSEQEKLNRAAQHAAFVAGLCTVVVALVKLFFYLTTGSMIVALSALDSIFDCAVSLSNRIVLKYARRTADTQHPYGYGRAENLAGLAQGVLILGGALMVVVASLRELLLRLEGTVIQTTPHSYLSLFLFIGSAAASFGTALWLKGAAKRFQSPALDADAVHYQMDIFSNLASAASVGLILFLNQSWLDPFVAICVGLYMIKSAYPLIKSNLAQLMDIELPEEERALLLQEITQAHQDILDIHDFRARRSGSRFFIDFHVTLPADYSFIKVHNIVDDIEEKLHRRFQADVVVHADPSSQVPAPGKQVAWSRPPIEAAH